MSTPKRKHPRAGQGGGAFGSRRTEHRQKIKARHVSQDFASNFAASVLLNGGEVHHVPDGNGGVFQISIINPGALRPANREGHN
jgi:hypothetical protein